MPERVDVKDSRNSGNQQKIYPVSFAQQQMWLLNQLDPGNPAYNIARAVRFRGPLSADLLWETLQTIVTRHESLRTTFQEFNGEPVQVITAQGDLELPIVETCGLLESEREDEVLRLARVEAQKPFDLERGPLIRTRLLRLGASDHVLLLILHHIVTDAWSMTVLFKEIGKIYEALALGCPSPLADLPIQYGNFAFQQNELMKGELFDQHLTYWRSQLEGLDPVLELPSDLARPAVRTSFGVIERRVFSTDLRNQLKALGRKSNATLFMTLLAAFQVLISRYTGREDIAIGSPTADRGEVELEELIGFFVNTVVIRTDLSGNPTFRELLNRVKDVALDAQAHKDVPIEKVIGELQIPRSMSYTPLFQAMFILQNAPRQTLEVAGLTLEELEFDSGSAKFDLTVDMAETDEGLACAFEYSTDVLEKATVERMLGHFQTLLEGIVADPERRLSDFPLMDAAEKHRVLVEWNNTAVDYPRDQCIHDLFEAQVERTPESVALICGDRTVTFQELNSRANKLAHYLRLRDVAPGAVVGISIERSIEAIVGLLAILKSGGAYVPMDPGYPRDRLAFMLEDSQATKLLTVGRLADRIPHGPCDVIRLDTDWEMISRERNNNPARLATSEDLAYVIYTSGSTGKPKGVLASHRSSVNRFAWMWNTWKFASDEVCCQKTSLSFVDSVWEIFGPLLQGIRSLIIPDEQLGDPDRMVQTLKKNQVSRIVLVPSLLRFLLDGVPDIQRQLPKLRMWITSGEAITPELVRRFHQILPDAKLMNLYGSSEVAGDVTFYPLEKGSRMNRVPIGRPVTNTQIYLLDRELNPVPIGVAGEIHVGGDNVARGYCNNPELTSNKFIVDRFTKDSTGRLYKTGDLGRFRSDGNIEFLGRVDTQVKIRGIRIELGEIENTFLQHSLIREAAVAVSGRGGNEHLIGYIVSDGAEVDEAELRSFLRSKLPDYLVPALFVKLHSLPLTPSGKVDRRVLAAREQEQQGTAAYVAPRNSTEERLAGIITEVLAIKRAGVHDNFFELGGHSLRGIQVIARVRKIFRVELPLRALFDEPTIAGLSLEIEKAEKRESVGPVSSPKKGIELLSRQRLLARLNQLSDAQVEALLSAMPSLRQDE